MIRKWLKFNASFVEIIKSSTNSSKGPDSKCVSDNSQSCLSRGSYSSLAATTSAATTTAATAAAAAAASVTPSLAIGNGCFKLLPSTSSVSVGRPPVRLWLSDPWEKGDNSEFSDSDVGDPDIELPERTELFEIRGPKGSAFLVEVHTKDVEEVKKQLNRLKGDVFHFDKNILNRFALKCLLTVEPLAEAKTKDRARLAKIHAIVSGSEEVQELNETGQFVFVNSIDRMMRAKTILEKLNYRVSAILYRFQPKRKVLLENNLLKVCREFIADVESLPKVLSVTHNM